MTSADISGVRIPDSKISREATEFIRDTESDLLFHHSVRVYFWGSFTGKRIGRAFDPELLYVASMFHDLGLTKRYENSQLRFEVDGANAARDFLQARGIAEGAIETVWNAIALHTTPGIPQFMRAAEIFLVQAGAGMDVSGRNYDQFSDEEREAVVAAFPRGDFKRGMIDAFYEGVKHRPDTTFGTFNDDYLAFKDPNFRRIDVCSVVLGSKWSS